MKATSEHEVEDLYSISYDYTPFKLHGEAYIKDTLENNSRRVLPKLQQKSFNDDSKLDLYDPTLNYIVRISLKELGCSSRRHYRMANTSCSFKCLLEDRSFFGHQLSSIFTIRYLEYNER